MDRGHVEDGKVKFDSWRGAADAPSGPPPAPLPPEERVGFAVVALGRLSLEQILPAFSESKKARLVALVSGSPDKMKAVASQYGIKESSCYSYESFDSIKDNPDMKAGRPMGRSRQASGHSARSLPNDRGTSPGYPGDRASSTLCGND